MSCHTSAGGSLTVSPKPFTILKGNSGTINFDVTSLGGGGSSDAAIAVQGLENPAIQATPDLTGWNWATTGGTYLYSDLFQSPGVYTLDLTIDAMATAGDYPIIVTLAGSGGWATQTSFILSVLEAVADFEWTDTAIGNYLDTANWSTGVVPGAADTAVFGAILNGTSPTVQWTSGGTSNAAMQIEAGDITFQSVGGQFTHSVGDLTITGGSLSLMYMGIDATTSVTADTGGTLNVQAGGVTSNTGGASVVTIGDTGSGTLNISAGGSVASDISSLGDQAGSTGTAIVAGSGSTWQYSTKLDVGNFGDGMLDIKPGGSLTGGQVFIAHEFGSTGAATVTGPDATWTNTGNLRVGYTGDGTMLITAGGSVTNDAGLIAAGATGTGTATVSGTGSTWTSQRWLGVGNRGNGTLIVENGGTVTSVDGYVGRVAGSYGTATITGQDSAWNVTGDMTLGGTATSEGGIGNLTIQDSGSVDVGGTLRLWSTGSLTLDGGSMDVHGGVDNSAGGYMQLLDGTLTVTGGPFIPYALDAPYSYFILDGPTTSDYPKLVLGAGSSMDIDELLFVGDMSHGELTVTDGAQLTSPSAIISYSSGSTGTVTVAGTNSTWTSSSSMVIGRSGDGQLTISDGGSVTNTHAIIGYSGSEGSGGVLVTGVNSSWTCSEYLHVGFSGTGTLNIEDGGSVSIGTDALIGSDELSIGGPGAATVTGSGSTWNIPGFLSVGNLGAGTLTVETGGTVTSTAAYIGRYTSANGSATVTGPDATWNVLSDLCVGGNNTSEGGPGSLTIDDNGLVDVGDTLMLWESGTVTLNGGTLNADIIENASHGSFDFNGGTLYVNTYNGTLKQQGGTLVPGQSPGTTVISGDYYQNAGALDIELGGTTPGTEFDVVNVTGSAYLYGDLNVSLIDGFTPLAGDSFGFMTAGNGLLEAFNTTNLPDISGLNLAWQLLQTGGTLYLNVNSNLIGDLDGDGFVGIVDLNVVLSSWNQDVPPGNPTADPTGDGFVGIEDLNMVLGNWNAGTPPVENANIPEPAAITVMILGWLALVPRNYV